MFGSLLIVVMKDAALLDCESSSLINDKSETVDSDVLLNSTAFDDVLSVLIENRFVVPFIFLLSILVGYQLSIAPYHL